MKEYGDVAEMHMFGGVAFLLQGNMCCGVIQNRLMLRVGPEQYEASLSKPHANKMDFTGRPMKGFIYVESAGFASKKDLAGWLQVTIRYVLSLPKRE